MNSQRLAILLVLGFALVSKVSLGAEPIIEVRWQVSLDMRAQAEKIIRPGLELKEQGKGERAPPLLVIAGAISMAYIVRSAIELYRDVKYGGVVLSVKGGKLHIGNDPRLPAGIVVVRDANNIQVLSTNRQNEGEILTKLVPLLAK